jgi:hypothetical protein
MESQVLKTTESSENKAHQPTIMDFALEFWSDSILDLQVTYCPQSVENSDDTAEDLLLFEDDSEAFEALPPNGPAFEQYGLFATSSQRKRGLDNAEKIPAAKPCAKARKRTRN